MSRLSRDSLPQKAAEEVRIGIERGLWRGILPSEVKLSRDMGVSRTTLRKALVSLARQGLLEIRQGKPTRIKAGSIGRLARLKSRRTHSVNFLAPFPLSRIRPYVLVWLDQLRAILHESGMALNTHSGKIYYREHSGKSLQELVDSHPADCWLLAFSNAFIQDWFAAKGIPTVVVGYPESAKPLPAVCLDNEAMMFHAIGQLTSRGHRRIAFFTEDIASPGVTVFRQTFTDTCAKLKSREIKGDIWLLPDNSPLAFEREVSRALRSPAAPTGLIIANPLHSLTAMTALPERRIRIPEDISIITTYGDQTLEYLSPAPAHYKVPYETFAKKMLDQINHVINSTAVAVEGRIVRITPEPFEGGSIGRAPSASE